MKRFLIWMDKHSFGVALFAFLMSVLGVVLSLIDGSAILACICAHFSGYYLNDLLSAFDEWSLNRNSKS